MCRHWCLRWIYFLYLVLGSSSSQFSPWGNTHLSLFIHSFSRFLSFCSICLPLSPCLGLTTCSGWIPWISNPMYASINCCTLYHVVCFITILYINTLQLSQQPSFSILKSFSYSDILEIVHTGLISVHSIYNS